MQTVAFSSDGQLLAAGDAFYDEGSGTVKIWDVQKRQVDHYTKWRPETGGCPDCPNFSSDDRYLASSGLHDGRS